MKRIALIIVLLFSIIYTQAQTTYQPYTLALNSEKSMDEIKANIAPAPARAKEGIHLARWPRRREISLCTRSCPSPAARALGCYSHYKRSPACLAVRPAGALGP